MSGRVTLKQVAQKAGVSYQTVSKVLNHQVQVTEETEQRIRRAADELGYRPNLIARSLRSQRSGLIGYTWAPSPPDQVNSILDQFLHSMAQACESSGYHLLCFPHHTGEEHLNSYDELIATNRVDGFVLSGIEFDDPRIRFLQEKDFPFVAFGRSNPEWDFPYVDVDGANGLRQVTEHFLQLGHRRIYAMGWSHESRVGRNRLDGYFAAMRAAGIEPQPDWIIRGEGRHQSGRECARQFMAMPPNRRPTAIVTLNDPMAVGAMSALQDLGIKVGEEVAIAGFDDAPMVQYLTPPLTSLRQPAWEIGQRVIRMLCTILDGEPLDVRHVLLCPELIIRQSSGTSIL